MLISQLHFRSINLNFYLQKKWLNTYSQRYPTVLLFCKWKASYSKLFGSIFFLKHSIFNVHNMIKLISERGWLYHYQNWSQYRNENSHSWNTIWLWGLFLMSQGITKIRFCDGGRSRSGMPVSGHWQDEQSSPLSASCSCISNAEKWCCTDKKRAWQDRGHTGSRVQETPHCSGKWP